MNLIDVCAITNTNYVDIFRKINIYLHFRVFFSRHIFVIAFRISFNSIFFSRSYDTFLTYNYNVSYKTRAQFSPRYSNDVNARIKLPIHNSSAIDCSSKL